MSTAQHPLRQRIAAGWRKSTGWSRRMSIVTRLVVLLLVVLLVPLGVTSGFGMAHTVRLMERGEHERMQQSARTAADKTAQILADTSRVLEILRTDPALVRLCGEFPGDFGGSHPAAARASAQGSALLTRAASWGKDAGIMVLTDAKGTWIASSKPVEAMGDQPESTRLALQACAAGALGGETFTAREMTAGSHADICFAAPIRTKDGALVGALVIRLDGAALQRACTPNNRPAPKNEQTLLLDENNLVLAHSTPARAGKPWTDSLEKGPMRRDAIETMRAGPDGEWLEVSRAPVAGTRWSALVAEPGAILENDTGRLRRQQTAIALLAASAVLILAIFQAREITQPLRSLRLAAMRVARGDLDAKAPVVFRDEVGELAAAFNHMTGRLRDHAKLRNHLRLAHEIQSRLLPDTAPRVPGLDICGFNRPADETGGDYFDYVDLSEWEPDTLTVFIGDVTGHGVAAAIMMATARAHIRACAMPPRNLSLVLADANRRILSDSLQGRFITVAALFIDVRTRRIRWACAGHDGPLLYDPTKDRVSDLEGEDIPLGVDPGWTFHEHGGGSVAAGSVILLGTDGIWETRNQAGEPFGKERLRVQLRESHRKSAEEIRRDVVMAVDAFRGPVAQEDDLTLVVVKFG